MEPRIPRDKAAALHVLGDLVNSPFVAPFVHDNLEPGGWVDFHGLFDSAGFANLSTGETAMVQAAASLYSAGHTVALAEVARVVDDANWRRVIEAQTMLRGLADEMYIGPGDWIDGVPG